jgi:hypothetical protein
LELVGTLAQLLAAEVQALPLQPQPLLLETQLRIKQR